LVKEKPSIFDFTDRMEKTYPNAGAGIGPRVFFRSKKSTLDLIELAKHPFKVFVDGYQPEIDAFNTFDDMDLAGGCSESCEIHSD